MKKALVAYALVIGASALVGCVNTGTLTSNTNMFTSRSDAFASSGTNSVEKAFDGGGFDEASASVVPQ